MAESYLAVIEKAAKEAGVGCDVIYDRSDSPYEVIIRVAEQKRLRPHHDGLPRQERFIAALLLGSETQKVLTHSKIPVLVYR